MTDAGASAGRGAGRGTAARTPRRPLPSIGTARQRMPGRAGRGGRAGIRRGLTRRGLILALIAFALTAMTIYPLRQYVTQQHRIEQLQVKQAALDTEIARLETERARLKDPEYVEQLAREELQMARPGEETYVMTGPAPAGRSADATQGQGEDRRPWYKRLFDGLLGRAD